LKLKETLNLPQTSFPMKANLPVLEPKLLERWHQEGLYQKIRLSRAACPVFTLHDGPPYANGNIHLGHAENKILKDFIVKSRTMMGLNAPYIPGWDCHGLPIEIKVDQALGKKKAEMTQAEVRLECRKYAEKFVELQGREFKRLGILGEWDKPYLTMSREYEAAIVRTFGKFVERGGVYKGLKPVHWCISCQTALAEAEVEYSDHASPSVYVKFPLVSEPEKIDPALNGRKVFVVIWTTTPWTLPANLGIAFNANLEYSAVATESGDVYILASDLVKATADKCNFKVENVLAQFKGGRLDRLVARHPWIDRESIFILGDHVTLEQGTGCVHTAPGHGHEDYMSGLAYGLEIYCPVNSRGQFTEEIEYFRGSNVFQANAPIVELLQGRGVLLSSEKISHSYPHCWRCHKPVIFRATPQWFIAMDQQNLRQEALEAIKKVRWLPEWGEERISNMIACRPDWCISRQRVWGVPITAFYCEGCNETILDKQVIDHICNLFGQEGADVWYKRDASELVPPGTVCPKCGSGKFRKETDILDVWFESGTSHEAVLGRRGDVPWPADVYIEGSDQYRGWFHSSLLIGIGAHGAAPYRQVLTHGWTLDADGRAMSKSLGNVIEPQAIVNANGAEILRLWVASSDFKEDVRISKDMVTRLSDAYFKFRNTARFMLANLFDFQPDRDILPAAEMSEIDRWAMQRTSRLLEKVYQWYADYEFHRIYHAMIEYVTVDLSAFYFDILKDRLYTAAPASRMRRSSQTALYRILDALSRALAPIYSFTCDEIWQYLPPASGRLECIHMEEFLPAGKLTEGCPVNVRNQLDNWDSLISVRAEVLKILEKARKGKYIGNALEAKVRLQGSGSLSKLLEQYLDFLPALFIVSQVELSSAVGTEPYWAEAENLKIGVVRADGEKCERCWNYSTQIESYGEFPPVCPRCRGTLAEMGI
jgi:isoleucyl-tRNA synthetase